MRWAFTDERLFYCLRSPWDTNPMSRAPAPMLESGPWQLQTDQPPINGFQWAKDAHVTRVLVPRRVRLLV